MADLVEFDPVITRKPEPLPPPITSFVCVICERVEEYDRWQRPVLRPPICQACTLYRGSNIARPSGITRGDHRVLKRLGTMVDALRWEVINGHWRQK